MRYVIEASKKFSVGYCVVTCRANICGGLCYTQQTN